MLTKTAGESRSVETQRRSSTSYVVPYIEVTCASFHSSQVPFHTWCHVWEWHLRRSIIRKFQFIHGAIYGSYMCVLPYITSLGAKDKQTIQRGAEQTSNLARRGTNKQLSEARNIQAIRGAAGQTSNCVFDRSSAFVAKIIYALFRRDPCMTWSRPFSFYLNVSQISIQATQCPFKKCS